MKNDKFEKMAKTLTHCDDTNSISQLLFCEVFDNYQEAVVVTNTNRKIIYVNAVAEKLFNYSKNEFYNKTTKEFYADENDFFMMGQKYFNENIKLAGESYKIKFQRSDKNHFLGLTTISAMCNKNGEVTGYISTIRPARSAEESLDALQKVHNITSNIALSHHDKIQSLLSLGLNHFGLEKAIISHVVKNDYIVEYCVDLKDELKPLAVFDLSDSYCVHTLSADRPTGFHYVAKSEIKNHPCYKNFKMESYIGAPIRLSGQIYGTVNFSSPLPTEPFSKDDYTFVDLLSETVSYLLYQKQSQERLERLASLDELTNLPNRRATMQRLELLMAQSHRLHNNLCILSIDIDHFKNINDTWGHAAGDLALVAFARTASSLGRKTDFCGRIGGEEFIFVLPGANLKNAQKFANNLRKHLAASQIDINDKESITLSISVGVAMLEAKESLKSLLIRADEAMYKAKTEGRDRVCCAISNIAPID